jgi:SpoVK/Ycf46/Vps4 family AAA+-type ATPase
MELEKLQRIVPRLTWKDLQISPPALQKLQELSVHGAQRNLSRSGPLLGILSGLKSDQARSAAEVLANDLHIGLYRVDLAAVVSKYIGDTEKNLNAIFSAAEQDRALLFFDEADSLFGKRTGVKDSHDRYANLEINYLLQKIEQYQGVVLLATNHWRHMDGWPPHIHLIVVRA